MLGYFAQTFGEELEFIFHLSSGCRFVIRLPQGSLMRLLKQANQLGYFGICAQLQGKMANRDLYSG
jgi:hypothetical protein